MDGTIKKLVRDRGFGFIRAGNGQEFFFHSSALSNTSFESLNEGQGVTFEPEDGPKGPRAGRVLAERG
mgnify:CR=1 FL=1